MGLAALSWILNAGLLAMLFCVGLRKHRPALIAVAVILGLQTVVRPLIFLLGLDLPYPQAFFDAQEWDLVTTTNTAVLGWVFCLAISYAATGQAATAAGCLLPRVGRRGDALARPALLIVAAAPLALALGGTALLLHRYGGFSGLIFASKVTKDLKGLFIIQEAATLACLLAWFGLLSSLRRGGLWPFGFAAMILAALSANFAWGNRYNIAILLVVFALSWHLHVGRLGALRIMVAALLAVVAMQMLKEIRADAFSQVLAADIGAAQPFWLDLSTSLHFVEYDALMLALRDAGQLFDLRHGADFINGLVSWVPRSLLPGKETFNVGAWFRQIYQPGIVNGWPVTTIGSWYVNFGTAGILCGALLSGFVVRVFDQAYRDIRRNAWSAAMGSGLAFLMIEGGVNTGFPQRIVLLIIPLWLAALFLRLRWHPRQTPLPAGYAGPVAPR